MKTFNCSICNTLSEGYGNNAEPVNSGRCCDSCNLKVVIPVRISPDYALIVHLEKLGFTVHSFEVQVDKGQVTLPSVEFSDTHHDYTAETHLFSLEDTAKEVISRSDIYSCCGDVLDKDIMICPTCKEHC